MHPDLILAYSKGMATMAGLIVAIGLQNVFVLRQGLEKRATFLSATICFLCDVIMVTLGTAGLAALFAASRWLNLLVTFGGTAFLLYYGARSLRAAWHAKGLDLYTTEAFSYKSTILRALAVSLLNPHAILDTVVLVGGLAAHYEGAARIMCAFGAVTASCLWFYSLAYGARKLAPLLSRPQIWRMIDLAIGVMMLSLATGMLRDGIALVRT